MKSINSQSDINVSRILRLIWQKDGISRIEIASELGLDKSTVTKVVSSLIEIGIVSEFAHGITGPQGGRKPVYLGITESFAAVGGMEINSQGFVCCLLSLTGKVLFEWNEQADTRDCIETFEKAHRILKEESQKLNIMLIGVGVGVSGIVNSDSGVIMQSISLNIARAYPLSQPASVIAGVPVFVENDARCCCYSERTLLHDTGNQNSMFILIEIRARDGNKIKSADVSVGTGLVINGRIFKGSDFSAGEFRSLLWQGRGEGQFMSQSDDVTMFADDSGYSGDSAEMHQSIFRELARHVAFLVNTLNLEVVYLGGIESELAKDLASLIKKCVHNQWPYENNRGCEVLLSSLGNLAVAYGAAGMFIDRFFALPSLSTPSGSGPSILESLFQVGSTGLAGKLV